MADDKIPVSLSALIQRINRKLKHDQQVLKKARGRMARHQFGDYYIINPFRNSVDAHHVDPITLANDLGVFAEWEELVQEEGN